MSLINRLMGRPETPAYPGYPAAAPTLDPSASLVGGPGTLAADAYAPADYRVPTGSPVWLPAAVTSYRSMETMAPQVSTRDFAVYKNVTREVPIETATRATRASRQAASAVEAAPAPVETATPRAATPANQAAAETAVAAEAAPTTRTVTERVKTMKTKVDAKPTLTTNGFLSAVKSSALVAGGLSLLLNGYAVIKGQQSFADGGANVVGDVAAGAVGGMGGVVASAFGAPMIASALGIAGGGITALSFGLGLAGYWLADNLFRRSGFFKSIKDDVHNLLSGNPGAVTGPAYAPMVPADPYAGYAQTPTLPSLPTAP